MTNRHYKTKLTPDHVEQINKLCETLFRYTQRSGNGLKFNGYQWVQRQVNNNAHPLAIIDGLQAVVGKWFDRKDPMKSAEAYARSVVKTKSGNYREAEFVEQSKEFKAKWKETIKNERLKNLASGIGVN